MATVDARPVDAPAGAPPAPSRDAAARRSLLTVGAVRLTAVVVTTLLAGASPRPLRALPWLVASVMAAAVAVVRSEPDLPWRIALTIEVAVASLGVAHTGGARSALLPYLIAPLFATGFRLGAQWVFGVGAGALVLVLSGVRDPDVGGGELVVATVEWGVLGIAFGLIAAWVRALTRSADDPAARYEEAHRLLTELRDVARRLPGSLDPVSSAESLLDACAAAAPYDRAGVLVAAGGDRLVPLAVRGTDRLDLDPRVSGDGHIARALTSGTVVKEGTRDVRSGMASLLVVPLPGTDGATGVVVLEAAAANAFAGASATAVAHAVTVGAARLEAARAFDEIRRLATVEERQRLAREIHDGIAQELAFVGYELDNLSAELRHAGAPERDVAVRVRQQVTRIVNELRLSIFNLRSSTDATTSLGAALSEYVRSIAGGTAVHLNLSEAPERLRGDVEAELLRIAQEAVTNARKHARAANLWVTLVSRPPYVLLTVEDDGAGIDPGARRGFGLDIMNERAARLGAQITVGPRDPRGTRVQVEVGRTE